MKLYRSILPVIIGLIIIIPFTGHAEQPGTYNSRDWNAGAFEPGGGAGTTEGERLVDFRITRMIKPGRKRLRGKKAWKYIGDIKERLITGNYTGEILLRSTPDPKHNTFSDGIIYNTGGGRNYYIKRKDGEHMIMLDVPGGREEMRVTKANYPKFENTMHDDNNKPYVLFDRDGNEAAIVFVDWHTRVKEHFNKTGEVIIELRGTKPARHRYR